MALIKKTTMTGDVFAGISAIYAVKGGFNIVDGTLDLTTANIVELPVSESGGVSINGGTPSTSVFKVHGLNAPWTSRITPGDAEVTLQVPTNNGEVLKLVYGVDTVGADITVKVPTGVMGTATTLKGKSYAFPDKAVNLGLLIINDTEDEAFFVKKVKLLASPQFDGEDTPWNVSLTGTIASGADTDAMAFIKPGTAEEPASE